MTPSGVKTSISVATEASNPLFCAGREKDKTSPGRALNPIDCVRVIVWLSLVLSTITDSV